MGPNSFVCSALETAEVRLSGAKSTYSEDERGKHGRFVKPAIKFLLYRTMIFYIVNHNMRLWTPGIIITRNP